MIWSAMRCIIVNVSHSPMDSVDVLHETCVQGWGFPWPSGPVNRVLEGSGVKNKRTGTTLQKNDP